MQIISVYVPTISYINEKVKDFYEEATSMNKKGKCYTKLITADWDSRIEVKKLDFPEKKIDRGWETKANTD